MSVCVGPLAHKVMICSRDASRIQHRRTGSKQYMDGSLHGMYVSLPTNGASNILKEQKTRFPRASLGFKVEVTTKGEALVGKCVINILTMPTSAQLLCGVREID